MGVEFILHQRRDPFGLGRFPIPADLQEGTQALRHIADIVAGDPTDPNAPSSTRAIYQDKDGRLMLAEISAFEQVTIGVPISFADAGELATAVLAGDSTAITAPLVAHTLALAYIGALVAAERQRIARSADHQPAAEAGA